MGREAKPTGPCSSWPPGSTWCGWVARGASGGLERVWLRVCGYGCTHKELCPGGAFSLRPKHRFGRWGAPTSGVRAGTGPALWLGWLQAALGSVGSRALKLQKEARGGLGGWCAAARALGPASLCSQPPLHMQRGSLAARGGSRAESGKPVKGGAGRAGAGLGSPRCCEDGDPGSPSHPHPYPARLICNVAWFSGLHQSK